MDSFVQSLILTGLMICIVTIFIHIVWIQPKLTRRRADAQRVLELAAASIQSVSYDTPTGAEDLVEKILAFRSLAVRSVDLKTCRRIEAAYFPDGWCDAHRVLAKATWENMQRQGRELTNGHCPHPDQVAACLVKQHNVAEHQYRYHFMEGDMERPDACEVIAASSRGSFGASFPLLAHYCKRAEERLQRVADQFYKLLLGDREISK